MHLPAVLLLLLLLATTSSPSVAAPITYFAPAQFPTVDCNGPPCPGNQPVAVNGTFTPFDASLGDLISVRMYGGGLGGAGITLSHLIPGSYDYVLVVEFALLGPGGSVLDTSELAIAAAGNVVLDDGSTQYPPHTGVPFEAFFIDGNSLPPFPVMDTITGLDYFLASNEFSFTSKFRFDFTGPSFPPGQVTSLDPDWVDGTFGVGGIYYTYIPIPEPATALLVGVGLMLISAHRARRNT